MFDCIDIPGMTGVDGDAMGLQSFRESHRQHADSFGIHGGKHSPGSLISMTAYSPINPSFLQTMDGCNVKEVLNHIVSVQTKTTVEGMFKA